MENMADHRPGAAHQDKALVRLSLASLLAIAFLGAAAIVLAYIGGVMSGRHSCPVPEQVSARPSSHPLPAPEDKSPVLSASELAFAQELRGENNRVAKLAPAEEKKTQTRQDSEEIKPHARTLAKKPEPVQGEQQEPPIEVEKPALPQPSANLFDHVFQVGAFRDENAVDKLRQTLEGYGLRTSMQKEGKVFVVLVRLRGTPERAAEMAALAKALGLGNPVQRSRQPVNN